MKKCWSEITSSVYYKRNVGNYWMMQEISCNAIKFLSSLNIIYLTRNPVLYYHLYFSTKLKYIQFQDTEKLKRIWMFRLFKWYIWGRHSCGTCNRVAGCLVPDVSRSLLCLETSGTKHPATRSRVPDERRPIIEHSGEMAWSYPRNNFRIFSTKNITEDKDYMNRNPSTWKK